MTAMEAWTSRFQRDKVRYRYIGFAMARGLDALGSIPSKADRISVSCLYLGSVG